ncbi:LysR family transcriptional regulator [Blastococcus sp. PRF04-17]|uniref:LysR family transcriptional regulator n=1 Tax=Blastococcus sp. PRF04-17 TaxID=2933797 RepID=UPI001FF45D20|nr:LysR family transcriptional regulator [Blastococcus sp. PRF04-17]UOY03718.1 LysR family transcriptional regulator [Blastococcus sp. PRF04-17]
MRANDITLRQLERFLAVLEAGSVRKGAVERNFEPQTFSSDLEKLATALGVKLFDSVRGKGSFPTVSARLIEGRVRELLAAAERLESYAKSLSEGSTGVISIAAYPVHLERFLARLIAQFASSFPDVSLDLSKIRDDRRRGLGRSLFEELRDGDVDFAMGPPHTDIPGIEGIKAYDARIVVLFPEQDPRASADQVPIEELRNLQLLTAPRTYFSRDKVQELAAEAGFDLKVVHEGSSPPALRALGMAGWGVPVLPDDYAVVRSRHHPVLIDAKGHEVLTPVWLHWRTEQSNPAPVPSFIKLAKELAAAERASTGAAAVSA